MKAAKSIYWMTVIIIILSICLGFKIRRDYNYYDWISMKIENKVYFIHDAGKELHKLPPKFVDNYGPLDLIQTNKTTKWLIQIYEPQIEFEIEIVPIEPKIKTWPPPWPHNPI